MSLKKKIIVLAHDPAAAVGLAPVINLLQSDGYDVNALADGPAAEIWRKQNLNYSCIQNRDELIEEIDMFMPDLIVTGTSFHSELDCFAIEEAANRSIPTFSFIDAEMNLKKRFIRNGQIYLPTAIGVISPFAKDQIEEERWFHGLIFIVGQPYLQHNIAELIEKRKQVNTKRQIVFISEPVNIDYPEKSLGFDQFDIANMLLEGMKALSKKDLVIKLHPRENLKMWEDWISKQTSLGKISLCDDDLEDLVVSSKIVCGINSMVLVAAALSGVLCVAIQPGDLKRINPLIRRIEQIKSVQTNAELKEVLTSLDELSNFDLGNMENLSHDLMFQADRKCVSAIEACF